MLDLLHEGDLVAVLNCDSLGHDLGYAYASVFKWSCDDAYTRILEHHFIDSGSLALVIEAYNKEVSDALGERAVVIFCCDELMFVRQRDLRLASSLTKERDGA